MWGVHRLACCRGRLNLLAVLLAPQPGHEGRHLRARAWVAVGDDLAVELSAVLAPFFIKRAFRYGS